MDIPALADLLDLQEVDLQIDRLLARRSGLPELERYRLVSADLEEAGEQRATLAGELRTLDLDVDKREGELQILEQRLKESETRLFAGGMSGKETEHKRLEVNSLRGQREALEERVLALLDQREPAAARLATADEGVAVLRGEQSALNEVITAAWKEIDAELARREARKAEIVPLIPADLLALYERLRTTKEGVAVGRMADGQCGGCHLHLSAAEQAEAAAADPPRCTHCRRILVL